MFDKLTSALQSVFRKWRGVGRLTERNIQDALREVRLALLEADVQYEVVRQFIERVKTKALGREVLESITPAQQMIKIVYDELVELLGGARRDLDWSGSPVLVLLLGLHGVGKTTTAAKMARLWIRKGKRVMLVGCDVKRPAAMQQLQILAQRAGAEFLEMKSGESARTFGERALTAARDRMSDVVVFDTAGRTQLDEPLVRELRELREAVRPRNVLLVVDAAMGQESVRVAKAFHEQVGLTGLVLTKLDGDARGGAALSIHAVTGCPIVMVGTGEHLEDLEPFYPDRMASRILGMGDIVSLVEKAQEAVNREEIEQLQRKLLQDEFTLEDFLEQIRQMRRLGPMEKLLEWMPSGGLLRERLRPEQTEAMLAEWKRAEAILCSMTREERRNPHILNASRKQRIARGSGTTVTEVNTLLQQFEQARRLAQQLSRAQKRLIRKSR